VRYPNRNETLLISRASGIAGAVADAGADQPAVSPGGRYVAFRSRSTNLAPGGRVQGQVYLRDTQLNTTTLVSRADGAAGAPADRASQRPSVSNTGIVAFESTAKNLSSKGKKALSNVFVRNGATGKTILVSTPVTSGGPGVAGSSGHPHINQDGTRVVFESDADDLSGADNNLFVNIFLRKLSSSQTVLVNRAPNGKPASSQSGDPAISGNGSVVAFSSDANNLSTEDNNAAASNVFLWRP
jgi:hypothetical protein